MVLQDWANWATIFGLPLTIIGLILAYKALKGQINTVGTQINTKVDKLSLEFKYKQEQPIKINVSSSGNAKTDVQIYQNYEKNVKEKGGDESPTS